MDKIMENNKSRNAMVARLLAEIAGRASSAMVELVETGELDSIQLMHIRAIADQATFVVEAFQSEK